MHVFDRRTDRQRTDGQTDTFLIASPRWHSMHRGKTKTWLESIFRDASGYAKITIIIVIIIFFGKCENFSAFSRTWFDGNR